MSKILSKIALFSIIFLSTPLWGVSRDGEELKILDDIIAASERQIAIQKQLRALIIKFQAEQDLFYEGPEKGQQIKEIASKMVDTGVEIQKLAEEHHYLHLFPEYFVDGLKRCTNVAKKKTQPVTP